MRALRAGRLDGAVVAAADADALVAVGVARDVDGERRAACAGRRRGALEREQRGAGEEEEGDHGETGLPGRPKTSLPSRVAEPRRLAGAQRDAPEALAATPSASSAGLTWSCGPTDTPPERTRTSAASSASAMHRARWRSRVVDGVAAADDLGAGARGQRGERRAVGVVDLAGLQRACRARRARRRWRRSRRAGAARRASAAAAGADGDAELGGAERACPARRTRSPPAQVLAGARGRCGRRATSSSSVTRSPSTSMSSTCRTPSAPAGSAAPVEIRTASPSTTVPS